MGRSPSVRFNDRSNNYRDRRAALKLLKYNRIFDFAPASGLQIFWQTQRSVAHASEAIHFCADRFEKSTHLAIPSLAQSHSIPDITAGALPFSLRPNGRERRGSIFKLDAGLKFFKGFRRQPAVHPRHVFALDFVARVHQPVGELSRVGEQQQPGRVDVEPPDGNPASGRETGKDGRAPLRIAAGNELADRLVVDEHPRLAGLRKAYGSAVDRDRVARQGAVSETRHLARDADSPRLDPGLDLAPRAEAGGREQLLQPLSLRCRSGLRARRCRRRLLRRVQR